MTKFLQYLSAAGDTILAFLAEVNLKYKLKKFLF